MPSDWTDWIDHDGRGVPLPVGTLVERRFDVRVDCRRVGGLSGVHYHLGPMRPDEWMHWTGVLSSPQVIRYRWKRSVQLRRLAELAEAPRETEAA
jgi:hypothetical protein